MRTGPAFFGDLLHQRKLGLKDVLFVYQPDAICHAEHMRIHRDPRLSEPYRKHHIRRLAAHARQADQRVIVVRHFTAEVAAQLLCHRDNIFRFCLIHTDPFDICRNILRISFCQRLRRRILREQRGRHLIDRFVCCLCG